MKIYRALFAATVVAFNMPNFSQLFGSIGFYGRFAFLGLLLVGTIFYAVKRHVRIPPGTVAAFYVFATYAFLTTFWTENFKLSAIKWVMYVALVSALFIGGLAATRPDDKNPFWPMKWIFVPIIVLSTLALARGIGWFAGNFRGFSGNSNALGATIVLTSPWLVYELRTQWHRERYRWGLLALSGAASVILLCTFSRASLGAMMIIVAFGGWGLNLGRKALIAYAMFAMLVTVYVLRPSAFSFVYQSLVEKRAENILASRSTQLQDSWEAAKKGGVLGVGFGVSVGESRYWDMQSFSTFAREKGNSALAVAEELGIVGVMLYLVLLYGIYGSLRQSSRLWGGEPRFVYMLSVGFFFGAIFHSLFEAWFMSSGPDVAVFWSTLGLAMGALNLRCRQTNEKFPRMEAATRTGVLVSTSAPRNG